MESLIMPPNFTVQSCKGCCCQSTCGDKCFASIYQNVYHIPAIVLVLSVITTSCYSLLLRGEIGVAVFGLFFIVLSFFWGMGFIKYTDRMFNASDTIVQKIRYKVNDLSIWNNFFGAYICFKASIIFIEIILKKNSTWSKNLIIINSLFLDYFRWWYFG